MTTTSSAQKPDLDWSQVRETVRMMNLAVTQIETSMRQGDDSVGTLTNAFTTMAARIQVIESLAQKGGKSQQIVEQCEAVSAEMKHTIVAFQFYDILTQRLSHVSHSLESLTDLVGDSARLYSPVEWSLLQEKIKSKYTLADEHHMFDMVMQGMSVEEALKQTQRPKDNGIELF
jgi:hypothetical protein